MEHFPTDLTRLPSGALQLTWNDGLVAALTPRVLREACPCASCKEKVGHPPPLLPVIKPEEAQTLQVRGMQPVGNYAYSIAFSDGHDTGIYTLVYLRELCQQLPGSS